MRIFRKTQVRYLHTRIHRRIWHLLDVTRPQVASASQGQSLRRSRWQVQSAQAILYCQSLHADEAIYTNPATARGARPLTSTHSNVPPLEFTATTSGRWLRRNHRYITSLWQCVPFGSVRASANLPRDVEHACKPTAPTNGMASSSIDGMATDIHRDHGAQLEERQRSANHDPHLVSKLRRICTSRRVAGNCSLGGRRNAATRPKPQPN